MKLFYLYTARAAIGCGLCGVLNWCDRFGHARRDDCARLRFCLR
jgi:hypothetical protein